MENGTDRYRIRQLETRLQESEKDRREIWRHQGSVDRTLVLLEERLVNLARDLATLTTDMKWVRRGLWTAAGSFALLIVAVAGLITQGP